jgi:hypothetical protein
VKPDVKLPAKVVGDTLTGATGGRDRASTVGDLFGNLKLEGLDTVQMDDLGGVCYCYEDDLKYLHACMHTPPQSL